jgi:glucokinase
MTTKTASRGSKVRKARNLRGLIASLDLGGTYIKAALVNRNGEIVIRERCSTEAGLGSRHVVKRLISTVHHLCSATEVSVDTLLGVGVGCAGPLNPSEGIVYHSPNLPGWSRVPIKAWMEESLELPVAIENDANAWALGEYLFGAGRGTRNMVCLTLGTGVGGGIVVDGRLVHGAKGLAAEFGHMTINTRGARCKCGNRGCLEVYASAAGVCRAMRRLLRKGVRTKVKSLMANNPKGLTSKVVAQAARQGDKPAQEALAEVGRYLGVGIANIANIFNPEMIVLGGAVAGAGRFLIEPARDESKRRAFPGVIQNLKIVRAKLGGDAALLGAAAPFLENTP